MNYTMKFVIVISERACSFSLIIVRSNFIIFLRSSKRNITTKLVFVLIIQSRLFLKTCPLHKRKPFKFSLTMSASTTTI